MFLEHLQTLKAYNPPLEGRSTTTDLLLDFNERTTPLPRVVMDELAQWALHGGSRVYPEYPNILEELAKYTEQPQENLCLGNGSDQLIDCIFRAVVSPGTAVLIPTPSFAMVEHTARLQQARILEYDLLADDPFLELEVKLKENPAMVWFCQPNNPTGKALDVARINTIVKENPNRLVVVDEAYYEFHGESSALQPMPENLIVLRTFSKAFGLAALRIGYAITTPDIIAILQKIRGPYDVNHASALAATSVLRHRHAVLNYVDEIKMHCKPTIEKKLCEKGIEFLPSKSNFLLLPKGVAQLKAILDAKGIRTRAMHHPSLSGALRISIPGTADLPRLMEALNQL